MCGTGQLPSVLALIGVQAADNRPCVHHASLTEFLSNFGIAPPGGVSRILAEVTPAALFAAAEGDQIGGLKRWRNHRKREAPLFLRPSPAHPRARHGNRPCSISRSSCRGCSACWRDKRDLWCAGFLQRLSRRWMPLSTSAPRRLE